MDQFAVTQGERETARSALRGLSRNEPVFVAGHRGLLGRALVRALQRRGHTPLVASRAVLDLARLADVERFLKQTRPRWLFLAAGRGAGQSRRPLAELARTTLEIQTAVLEAARRAEVERLVLFGSSCMYPRETLQPMREDALWSGPLDMESRAYASAQLAGVELCRAYRAQYGCSFFAMVPATLYGPHDHFCDFSGAGPVIPALLDRFREAKQGGRRAVCVPGSGKARREFLYVDDAAEAALFLMDSGEELDVVNAGSGQDASILELAELLREVTGFGGDIELDPSQPDGPMRQLLDVRQLRALGFAAVTSLRTGLERTHRWREENAPWHAHS